MNRRQQLENLSKEPARSHEKKGRSAFQQLEARFKKRGERRSKLERDLMR